MVAGTRVVAVLPVRQIRSRYMLTIELTRFAAGLLSVAREKSELIVWILV